MGFTRFSRTHTRHAILAVANAVLLCVGCAEKSVAPAPERAIVRGRLGSELDRLLNASASEGFSGVVLVAKEDAVILKKGYGFANREHGTPNTPATIFNICSISKIFTASAILHLETQGKLSVQDRLETHLGTFPEEKSAATIHHLLTHTAGLAVRGTDVERAHRDDFVQIMKEAPLESAPGVEYRYTNAGFSLLAAIVESVSGQSFEIYVQEHLLRPAGMHNTTFRGLARDERAQVAAGYRDESATDPVNSGELVWGSRGAGGMLATVGDLYAWELALRNDSVLSEQARAKMFTAYRGDEGYGWHVAKTERKTAVHHRGCGNPGFQGQYARYPEDGVTILVLSNNGRGWRRRIWEGIAAKVFVDRSP